MPPESSAPLTRLPVRDRAERLGVAVVKDLVELIVTRQLDESELLPPEGPLSEQFGVSRTVLRESVKRLEEKGLVTVTQGRGTHVNRSASWNMLDPVVLQVLIENDDSLGVLDELTTVRASLESTMAGLVAGRRTTEELVRLDHALTTMRETEHDGDAFRQADVVFHFTVMELSRNALAGNIAKNLYLRALESSRYQGLKHDGAFELTMEEHSAVFEAIRATDAPAAQTAMFDHIHRGWARRRLPDAPSPD